jgi:hypothetical protein
MSQYTVLNPLARALGNKGMTNVARNTRRILTKPNKNFLASKGPNMNTLNPTFGLNKRTSPLTIRTPLNSPSTTPANSPRTPPVSTTANMGRFSSIIPKSPESAPVVNTRRNNNRVAFPPQQARPLRQGGRKSRKNKNKRRRQ